MINESSQLSEREREILRLVATGLANQQIANQLGISVNTVKVHLRNVFAKIGVASRTEATMYAIRMGIVDVAVPPVESVEGTDRPVTADVSLSGQAQQEQFVAMPPLVDVPSPESSLVDPAPDSSAEQVAVLGTSTDAATHTPAAQRPRSRRRLVIFGAMLVSLVALGVVWLGSTSGFGLLASSESSEPLWETRTTLPASRAGFASTTYNGRIYVIGGDDGAGVTNRVDRYDPGGDTWARLRNKPTPVVDVQAVAIGGKIYVPGGARADRTVSDVFEMYDPQNEQWLELAKLPAPRSGYTLAAIEGELFLFGGWDGTKAHATVWSYDIERNAWNTQHSQMPTPRAFASSATTDELVYVLGGEVDGQPSTANERYNAYDDASGRSAWTTLAPLPTAQSHGSAVAVLSTIHVFGGKGQLSWQSYQTLADTWIPHQASLPDKLTDVRSSFLGTRLYVLGGRAGTQVRNTVYEYQALFQTLVPNAPR